MIHLVCASNHSDVASADTAWLQGAGHMVPQYQPAAALYLFEQFLSGKSL